MPGVNGAICVDQHGLCLSAKGNVSKYVSGPVAAIAHHAATLNGQTFSSPVIVIESQNGKMLIKQEEGFTTAIIKS
ncbi:hypothetical protein C0Q70_14891 [Pomacea canaliculata]|uniref:Late endosomal/lysosomal adaptor and MAPK and MTOR activator 5 n=2 Tax=Pomacea canaliculata TaxID=400727 RepID=A0A2T7NTB4_POMCA|nr:hypothetical protein C0Q70_14891 [Pomacea canaliculata]